MRRPALAANWKMHKSVGEALAFAEAFIPLVKDAAAVDVIVAPPFTALERMGQALAGGPVALAAQNVSPEPKGAFTGELAVPMARDAGAQAALVGHSERRHVFGETDEETGRKLRALLEGGLVPMLCVGEKIEQREARLRAQRRRGCDLGGAQGVGVDADLVDPPFEGPAEAFPDSQR